MTDGEEETPNDLFSPLAEPSSLKPGEFPQPDTVNDPLDNLFPVSPRQSSEELNLDLISTSEATSGLFPSASKAIVTPPPKQQKPSRVPPQPPPAGRSRKRPQTNYYNPNDYYLGTDWPRIIVGGLISLLLIGGIVLLAVYLFNQFDSQPTPPIIDSSPIEEIISVRVYSCAGDSTPVNEIEPPTQGFLEGKNAAGTWIAFRDPASPLNQLWAQASELPILDFNSLAILSCESSESTQSGSSLPTAGNSG